jgi:hypothetical protein
MSVVWKNVINTMGDELEQSYLTDLGNTLRAPQTNSFSVKVLYYLDYLNIKKAFTKKKKAPEE